MNGGVGSLNKKSLKNKPASTTPSMTPSSIDGLVDIPVVNWPAAYGSYKFVQLEIGSRSLLRFAETDLQSHQFVLRSSMPDWTLKTF